MLLQKKFSTASNESESGFTLLETLIALAMMVMAMASILSLESNSINATLRTRQLNTVAMLAKQKMVLVEYDIEGKTFDEVKKEDAGTFKSPHQDYRWELKIKEIEFPTLNINPGGKADGSGGGGGGGANQIVELITRLVTNFLSKAVREVNLTVFWKRGSGEQSFTVTTYWVDLNHEFALSE